MLKSTKRFLLSALLGLAFAGAAYAANTTFFTSIGDQIFPFKAPTASAPGTIDNMAIGQTTPAPATFSSVAVSSGSPTIASGACGATTNGTVSGTNQSGQITIGSATTTTCTVSFSQTLAAAPNACVLFPENATAAATGTTVARVSAITTAHFVVTGSALASSNYYYVCL